MKKIISLTFVLLLCLGISGCGSKEKKNVRAILLEHDFEEVNYENDDELMIYTKAPYKFMFIPQEGEDGIKSNIEYDVIGERCMLIPVDPDDLFVCDSKEGKKAIDKLVEDLGLEYDDLNITGPEILKMDKE